MASYMHPSSSSSSIWEYEVFLSFRGGDTRKTFTGHLYYALYNKGVCTFMDSEELKVGEEIAPALFNAIEHSKISIPIFSKDYADSKWCLKELVKILQCRETNKQIVLPIFFDVEPSEVGNQTGSFQKAFQEHEENFNPEVVEEWRRALKKVGKVKGWDLKEIDNKNEPKLVQLVVETVLDILNKTPLQVAVHPIGHDSHVEYLLPSLNYTSNDPNWNQKKQFKEYKVLDLSNCLDLTKSPNYSGFSQLERLILRGCTALVDIHESIGQLKMLLYLDLGYCTCLMELPSSIYQLHSLQELILLSSGLKEFPKPIGDAKSPGLKKLKVLDLCYCSNLIKLPDFSGFPQLERLILFACEALVVVDESIGQLKKLVHLDTRYCTRLMELPCSIYTLDSLCELIILSPVLKEFPKLIGASESPGFENLKVLDLTHCSKLTKFPDFSGFSQLERLILYGCVALVDLDKSIGQLKKLAHLDLRHCTSLMELPSSIYTLQSLKELFILLPGLKEFPIDYPKSSGFENLKVLDLTHCSKLTKFPDFSGFSQLERLILYGCVALADLDKSIGKLKKLVHLDLRYCTSLMELPSSIYTLHYLKELFILLPGLKAFPKLIDYPKSLGFQYLKVLDLTHCSKLTKLPEFSGFPQLERLTLYGCVALVDLDKSIAKLKQLVHLDLRHCTSLMKLPSSIYTLQSLQELLILLPGLEEFPIDYPKSPGFQHLKVLDLTHCSKLTQFRDFSKFPQLERLILYGCVALVDLDESIGQLKQLVHLDLRHCTSLMKLPSSIYTLQSLQELLILLPGLEEFPIDYPKSPGFQHLKVLDLTHCSKLTQFPEFSKFPQLERLILYGCVALVDLDESIGQLKQLVHLDLRHCTSLMKLPSSIYTLHSLEELFILLPGLKEFPKLIDYPKPPVFENLKVLDLSYCSNLVEFPDFSRIPRLERLIVRGCKALVDVHDSNEQLKRLVHLSLEY